MTGQQLDTKNTTVTGVERVAEIINDLRESLAELTRRHEELIKTTWGATQMIHKGLKDVDIFNGPEMSEALTEVVPVIEILLDYIDTAKENANRIFEEMDKLYSLSS